MMVLKFADHYITYTCHQSNGADSSTCDIPETVDKNWENLITVLLQACDFGIKQVQRR